MPAKFQNHCSDRLLLQGEAEKVLALALTVCIEWNPGKGPFLSPHIPTYKMGWLASMVLELASSSAILGF